MLPPTSNQLTLLPGALVVYSHHLLGTALKTVLVRYGVEVTLVSLDNTTVVSDVDAYTYIIFAISGQDDFDQAKELLSDVFAQLTHKTKLSVVICLAQSAWSNAKPISATSVQEFDFSLIQKTFETLTLTTSSNTIKSQLVFVEDLVDFSPSDLMVNPLQAMIQEASLNQINVVGSPEQVCHPLSSIQAAEVIARELFVQRQKLQIVGVRGKLDTTLFELASELRQVLWEKSGVEPTLVSSLSDHRFSPSAKPLPYVTPHKATNLNQVLQTINPQTTQANQVLVPHLKELPIPMEMVKSPPVSLGTWVLPTPQPQHTLGNLTEKKVIVKSKQVVTPKPAHSSIRLGSPQKSRTQKSSLLVGAGMLLLSGALMFWLSLPFLRYASVAAALAKPTHSASNYPSLVADLTRAQERITIYFSFVSRFTPATVDEHLFSLNQRLKQSTNMLVVQEHLESLNQKLRELVSKNLNLTDGDVYQEAVELAQLAQQNYQELTTLELGFNPAQQDALLTREPEFSETKLKSLKTSLKKLQLGLESLPHILPPNQSTNVLVLVQNSHELRPTGGFIESMGLLRFNSGKLLSSEFSSSYELDDLLKGKVEPPEDLRQFLGENQWYSRDANWDPDFVSSAKNAAWFYEKQTNNKVDVVVALSLPALGSVLDAIDGITLVDGMVLNNNNLSSWLTEAQKKLSGTQTTQALLGPVVESIFKKIQSPDQVDLFKVAQAMGASLEKAEILVAATKPETNLSLASLGWTGSVLSPVCPAVLSQAECVVNTLYINESNVGVNSANAQVTRSQTHTVSFQGDKIVHTHQTNFVHSGHNDAWPGGVYQNYVRYYLPQNARLLKATQDGMSIADADIVQNQVQNKNVIGFLVRIPPTSSSQVVIEYDEINPIAPQNALTYAFLMQKQPGITQAPLSLILNYPPGYALKRVSHPYALSDNHLMVNDSLAKHFFLAVELTP